ncbi:MAG: radical SAM protein [Methanomassiliicoccaceae archaeon]|jgi:DNA repair photolyase|nr:radical SAM protein [Methanomassiliicoccaceae archaeon]
MSNLLDFTGGNEWNGRYQLIKCKKALSPSKLPGIDHALNPYGGCEHGCLYCYAPELTYTEWDDWRTVRVRMGIESRLGKEISAVKGTVGIGTTTDPYQPAEERFELTRKCLIKLKEKGVRVHIHTKSDLILRDLQILKGMEGEAGITLTSIDEASSKIIEPNAPSPARRLDALAKLTSAGIDTYALVGPVLSVLDSKEEEFVNAIISTGTRRMFIDSLNHRPLLSQRMQGIGISGSDRAKERIRSLASSNGMIVSDVF